MLQEGLKSLVNLFDDKRFLLDLLGISSDQGSLDII